VSAELYIYWRVPHHQLAAAVAGMTAFQAEQVQRVPRLQARLLQRADDETEADQATLMEIYTLPGGLPLAVRTALVVQGAQAAATWCQGPRHVEVFLPLSG
jgi:hypothetical protein